MNPKEQFSSLALESGTYQTRLTRKYLLRQPYEKRIPGVIKAQIPGTVAEIDAVVGKMVLKGDTLMILDAMKMLNRIKAPHDGIVKALCVAAGQKISKGQILIVVE